MTALRLGDNFGEVLYGINLSGAFDLTTPLQGWHMEASARGLCVIVQVTLVEPDIFYGGSEPIVEENDNG